jgi:hypothetical protein
MTSDGSYPTRASRRAERAPQRSRASVGTAIAILIVAAIIGFAGGAIAGSNSGGQPADQTTETAGDPTADASPDDTSETETDENGNDDGDGNGSDRITLNASPSSVSAGDRIDLTGRIDPPVAGVELRVERSVGSTDAWDSFPGADNQVTATTNANGEFSTWVQSSRQGVNYWKLVGTVDGEFAESNVVEVTIN